MDEWASAAKDQGEERFRWKEQHVQRPEVGKSWAQLKNGKEACVAGMQGEGSGEGQ